jgi:signal transduction histidine kinase
VGDDSAANHLYFIAQEAILNAVKHGKANLIEVKLEPAGDHGCVLTVRDDGRGLSHPLPAGPGIGIRIMKYRARMIGATVALRASPSGGTEVVCQFIREPKPVEDRVEVLEHTGLTAEKPLE